MTQIVELNASHIETLELQPIRKFIDAAPGDFGTYEQQLQFNIDIPRDPSDPRELSELPEIRLWFLRLDATCPWLPLLLDWQTGEAARHAAMLVPHQFNRNEGIQFNPEALEIYVMGKLMVMADWLKQHNIAGNARLKSFAQLFGYDIDDSFFELIG
ncbi:MAG: CRR6 family NdhI maturation factor [Cyanobacteria bacterium P01_H01_bin.15]